ncbi:winged helix-turn-helix domain-containing protein [Kangiella sediminilitoris]|uniref:Transcriptional regulator, CadC n=1 Tax=Kangiella sediminilitoris TaxID=1144748 RepID=A0A1B3B9B9_9GAMM|nr:winged helix-turn-helix domain-containing protein [Kangiella sediminilitoris]AOE49380.1 Transcriptional regulator, CadC [Kangiella sediminilitoris]
MPKIIKVGDWFVYPDTNKLCFNDVEHYIEPLAMDVLVYFAQHPQQVVSRNELIDAVWSGRIVGDHAVYRIINKLRKTLAKDSEQEYIKTIRKKGYQLVCDVVPPDSGNVEESTTVKDGGDDQNFHVQDFVVTEKAKFSDQPAMENEPKIQSKRLVRWIKWSLLLVSTFIMTLLGIKLYFYQSITGYNQSTSLITLNGSIRDPSFSPDGNYIAFSYRDNVKDNWDIYVESLQDGRLYQISDDITDELNPAWAPDGSKVAVLRYDNKRCMIDVIEIPLTSGQKSESSAESLTECSGVLQHNDVVWGREGKYLYYTSSATKVSPLQIFRLTIRTGKTEQLTNYTQGETRGALGIKLSADNKHLAILKDVNWRNSRIDVLNLESLSFETVRELIGWNRYFDWANEGNTLIYNRNSEEIDAYHLSAGVEKNIAKSVEPISFPVHSPIKQELAVVAGRKVVNIVAEPISADSGSESSPLTVVSSSSIDNYAEYANTSDRIAFISRRSGKPQIWLKELDGEEKQLTSFEQSFDIKRIRWSPDDTSLLFIHDNKIYQLSLSSKKLKVLYQAEPGESVEGESWNRTGDKVLFSSNRDGDWQVYLLPINDGNRADSIEQITFKGGYAGVEAPEQNGVFYLKYHVKGLWFKSYSSEKERLVVDNVDVFSWNSIYLRQNNIYYLSDDYPRMKLYRYDIAAKKREMLQPYYGFSWLLSISFEADKLLYQRSWNTQSSLVLLKP